MRQVARSVRASLCPWPVSFPTLRSRTSLRDSPPFVPRWTVWPTGSRRTGSSRRWSGRPRPATRGRARRIWVLRIPMQEYCGHRRSSRTACLPDGFRRSRFGEENGTFGPSCGRREFRICRESVVARSCRNGNLVLGHLMVRNLGKAKPSTSMTMRCSCTEAKRRLRDLSVLQRQVKWSFLPALVGLRSGWCRSGGNSMPTRDMLQLPPCRLPQRPEAVRMSDANRSRDFLYGGSGMPK